MKKVQALLAPAILIVGLLVGVSPAHALSCPAGSVSYSSTQCVSTPSSLTSDPNMNTFVVYNCLVGVLSGTKCITSQASNYPALLGYNQSCNAGDSLNLGICTHTTTASVPATTVYYCNSGTLSGTNCTNTTQATSYAPSASTTYSCPAGDTSYSSICFNPYSGLWENPQPYTTYSCPSGGTLSNGPFYTCTIPAVNSSVPASSYLSCPQNYTYSGGSCYTGGTSTYNAIQTAVYSCNVGATLSGTTCYVAAVSVNAQVSYSGYCPINYSVNTSTGTCDAVSFVPNAVAGPVSPSYLCTSTFYDGSTKTQTFSYDATWGNGYIRTTCIAMISDSPLAVGDYLCIDQNSFNIYASSTDISSSSMSCLYTLDNYDVSTYDPNSDPSVLIPLSDPCSNTLSFQDWLLCQSV